MENALTEKDVVAKEIAIAEYQDFVEKFTYERPEDWKVEDDYPQALKAIQKGLLKFESNKPKYTLLEPLVSNAGGQTISEIDFRTRIKPMDLARITDGLNISKKQMEYTLRCLAYLTKIDGGKVALNKLGKFDYKVIEQVATVFF